MKLIAPSHDTRPGSGGHLETRESANSRAGSRGQVVVMFAGAMVVLMAMMAIVIDVSWLWTNSLRVQRAADAAALAGVVYLPGKPTVADTAAKTEAKKNGYDYTAAGIEVISTVDPSNNRKLGVTITAPVGTFFMRIFGMQSWNVTKSSKAEYVLPVPMGSPDNYYGVGYYVQPVTTTTPDAPGNSGWKVPTGTAPSGGQWALSPSGGGRTITTNVNSENNEYAQETTNGDQQQWATFGLLAGAAAIPSPGANQTLTITGIEVRLTDAFLSASCANSTIGVDLSWNQGGNGTWSTRVSTPTLTTTNTTDYTLPTTNIAAWGGRAWTRSDFSDTNLRVRLTANKGCATAGTSLNVDMIEVRVTWNLATAPVTNLVQDAKVLDPYGNDTITRPQKFWGAMQSQGAPAIQGDAFMTKYSTRTSVLNLPGGSDPDTYYDYTNYYNYAVEIPAGGGGTLWVFDPGFCDVVPSVGSPAVAVPGGTGENWTVGGANGNSSRQPVSAYFDLWNTKGTADFADDTLVVGTGSTYQRLSGQDHVIYDAAGGTTTSGIADCATAAGHLGWVQIASNLNAGTYRLHTYSTDPSSLTDQDNSTALNAFAFYASSTSGTPRIYGIGAMEAYVRLPANQVSEFYLAQIEAAHRGKTMVINLWDPGDTGNLSANLQILAPTGSGFTPAQFDYQGTHVSNSSGNSSGCGSEQGTGVFSVTTNTGGTSLYNGCWLTIEVVLPTNYSAPTDPASGEAGWWKIRYTMGNQSGTGATDLTTWKVDIRGNPVHLVVP